MKTILRVDAMYYHAAREAFDRATSAMAAVSRQRTRVSELQEQIDEIRRDEHETGSSRYEDLEPLAIQIEGEEYSLGQAYGPILQAIASTHILSAASLEAHVNGQAEHALSRKLWDHFERLSLEAKWLFLPKILGTAGFHPGAEPYQSFSLLVRYRNGLAHYKPKREDWAPPGIPDFLEDLGLTEGAALRSLGAVPGMISALAKQLGQDVPKWVEIPELSFIDLEDPDE